MMHEESKPAAQRKVAGPGPLSLCNDGDVASFLDVWSYNYVERI